MRAYLFASDYRIIFTPFTTPSTLGGSNNDGGVPAVPPSLQWLFDSHFLEFPVAAIDR